MMLVVSSAPRLAKRWNLVFNGITSICRSFAARRAISVRCTASAPRAVRTVGISLLCAAVVASGSEGAQVPFSSQQVLTTAADFANSVYGADLDGDGDLDLLTASRDDDEVAWYENDGAADPSFTRIVISTDSDSPRSVYAGDLDGDGDLDLLSASAFDDEIAWYENDGATDPSFTRIVISTAADGAASIYAGDVDGDGDLDLMSASTFDNEIAWYENDGAADPSFTRIVVTTQAASAQSVYAGDVDGDGDLDLLSASSADTTIAWYENDGASDPSFTRTVVSTTAGFVFSVHAGDLDGDGDLDLMSAAGIAGSILWFENDGAADPSFTSGLVFGPGNGLRWVSSGDVDGDGDLDLLSATEFDDAVAWYENDGAADPSFTRVVVTDLADGAQEVYAGDLDGDGDLDLMSASRLDDKIAWYENETIHRSALFPQQRAVSATADGARSVYAGDVDGDGDLDLMSASFDDDVIAWYENDNADMPSFARVVVSAAADGARSVHAGDVDGDGDLDLMSASGEDDTIAWYENDGGADPSFVRNVVSTLADGASSVHAGDLDGDGDLDLLSASSEDDTIAWYENDGGADPSFVRNVVSTLADGASSVFAGDVDGDGDLDLMSASFNDDTIAWYLNDGAADPSFLRVVMTTLADGARSVSVGDLDGDGDLDLLSASSEDDTIAWYENDGMPKPTFSRIVVTTFADGVFSVHPGDVDKDGDLDLVSASRDGGTLAWYENDGEADPSFIRTVISSSASGARSAHLADLDGDGDLDLLSASSADDTIAWYENGGGQLALPTADIAPTRTAPGAMVAALEIETFHRGRDDEQDMELVTLELLLEDGSGTPLTDSQADALLSQLAVYLDDGSDDFTALSDTEVAALSSFTLDNGVLALSFVDGDPNVQIPFDSSNKYFVVLITEALAAAAVPDEIRVTHLTESSSTGEDAEHDVPVTLEQFADTSSAVIEVNDTPVALDDSATLLEDSGTVTGNVLDGSSGGLDSDEELDSLTANLDVGPANGTLSGGLLADGSFSYEPDPDFNGVDSFTYVASDGLADSNTATVVIVVEAVNDAPSFTLPAIHSSLQDQGPQTVAGFATGISAGPVDEIGQNLTFQVLSNTNPAFFLVAPALATDGTLTYTANAGVVGTATIMVQLMDDGGTANGGVDTSSPQEFDIEIRDETLPQVVAVDALPGGLLEDCTELDRHLTTLVLSFSEAMSDPPGDTDSADVTNPDNYQLIAAGADNDVATLACGAPAGDDVLTPVSGVTFDAVTRQATVSFAPRVGDDLYRLLVCDQLEDVNGNPLEEDFAVTFRQDAESLFTNGQFDCDLEDWELMSTTPEEIDYSPEDVDDASASGSAHITNLIGTRFAIGQCVDSIETSFRVGADLRIDGAADLIVDAAITCESFPQAQCLGVALEQASNSQLLSETSGSWQSLRLDFDASEGTESIFCAFSVDQQAGGMFSAFFDDLTLRGDLFSDDFESGNVSAWSLSVP